jgi:glucosylceramidase
MPNNTRREFLRLAAGVTLAATNPRFPLGTAPPQVQAWVTSKDRRLEEVKLGEWRALSGENATGVTIEASKRFQEMLGFGGAFTDASSFLLSQLEAQKRQALLEDLFGKDGLRLSVGRTCIGSSDYSRFAYSYDESIDPDPDLLRSSIDHDRPKRFRTWRFRPRKRSWSSWLRIQLQHRKHLMWPTTASILRQRCKGAQWELLYGKRD